MFFSEATLVRFKILSFFPFQYLYITALIAHRHNATQGLYHHYNCFYWYAIATTTTNEFFSKDHFPPFVFCIYIMFHSSCLISQYRNKINENSIIKKLLTQKIYLENTKIVKLVILLKTPMSSYLSILINWLEKHFGISRKLCIIRNTSKNWYLIFIVVVVFVSLYSPQIRHSRKLLIHITEYNFCTASHTIKNILMTPVKLPLEFSLA